jgi:hypothetical protein
MTISFILHQLNLFLVNHSKWLSSAPFMGEDLTASQRRKGTYRENDDDYSFK